MVIARAELLCDEAIYRRTTAGQREVIFDQEQLPPMARRFLLLVNGETPLRERIRTVYTGLEALLRDALADDHPGRPPATYHDAAYQILALAYGHWTLAEMGFPAARAQPAHQLALTIVDAVATSR